MKQKKYVVFGAGGFIGSHLVKRLKADGHWVRGVDLKYPEFSKSPADEFIIGDLCDLIVCEKVIDNDIDVLVQYACKMGGAGFIFTGLNDAEIMHDSALVNLNTVKLCAERKVKKVFYSSSACMYPAHNQTDPLNPMCKESSAYPADPDSEYGWEKLFSERLYLAFARNHGLNVRIARYHNIFGPESCYDNGKEKAPAAISRKVALADKEVEVWGPGNQTRSFLYIDECIEATLRLMESEFTGPVNIGSEEMISINDLTKMAMDIAGKQHLTIKNVPGPVGVNGRNSDNELLREKLGWEPSQPLKVGMEKTYQWIEEQLKNKK